MKTLNEIGEMFVELTGCAMGNRDGLQRVQEELDEAKQATTNANLAEEMADVILTLAACAAVWGIDLDEAVQVKHAINMKRKWGPHPSIPGAVKRVKESI